MLCAQAGAGQDTITKPRRQTGKAPYSGRYLCHVVFGASRDPLAGRPRALDAPPRNDAAMCAPGQVR